MPKENRQRPPTYKAVYIDKRIYDLLDGMGENPSVLANNFLFLYLQDKVNKAKSEREREEGSPV